MINIYNIVVSKILSSIVGILTLGGSGIWNITEVGIP